MALLGASGAHADTIHGRLDARFRGTSTLHDFEGRAAPVEVVLVADGGRWSGDVRVPVASLDTGNGWRDDGLRSLLRADAHPDLIGRLTAVDPDAVRRDGTLPVDLTIAGTTRPAVARIRRWEQSADRLVADVELDVSLAAYGLTPPRTLFIRVGDTVSVTVGVELRRK